MTQLSSNDGDSEKRESSSIKTKKFICYAVILAPIIYIVVLIILQIYGNGENQNSAIYIMNLIFVYSSIYGLISILLIYRFFIPLARRGKDLDDQFNKYFLVLMMAESIAIYGLIYGILGWIYYGVVPFHIALPFIGIGMAHSYYIYVKYMVSEIFEKD